MSILDGLPRLNHHHSRSPAGFLDAYTCRLLIGREAYNSSEELAVSGDLEEVKKS